MNPTIYDICNLFTEPGMQQVGIFDLNTSREVFKGTFEEMPDEYNDLEVQSIDNMGKYGSGEVIVFNVEIEE